MAFFRGSGFRVQGLRFRVQGSGFRVQGFGFRVWGLGFFIQLYYNRVWGLGLRNRVPWSPVLRFRIGCCKFRT